MYNLKKMKKIDKFLSLWTAWLILVILWNYGYPKATPIYDVLVAAVLSIIFILINKTK